MEINSSVSYNIEIQFSVRNLSVFREAFMFIQFLSKGLQDN